MSKEYDGRATITVDEETKDRAKELKRDGLTWDAWLNDAIDALIRQEQQDN